MERRGVPESAMQHRPDEALRSEGIAGVVSGNERAMGQVLGNGPREVLLGNGRWM